MKMRNVVRRSIVFLMACMLCCVNMPVFAATTYTPVAGETMSFNKYLIVPEGTMSIPSVSFTYTVAAGEAISTDTGDNAVYQVNAGPSPEKVTVTPTAFATSDVASAATSIATGQIDIGRQASDRATGKTAETGVQFDSGEKYMTKSATVSFASVKFTEPGVYRYIITETAATAAETAAGIMHDDDVDRILDVYVVDNNGALEIATCLMHTTASEPVIGTDMGTNDSNPLADKTDGFTNEYRPKDLAIKKEVYGNQASKDKWFELTVQVTGLPEANTYTISLADDNNAATLDGNADSVTGTTDSTRASNRNKNNPTNATGAELAEGVKFYLQHGQHIVVRGLPQDAVYTVTEDAEDYKSTAAGVTDYTDAVTGTIGTVAESNSCVKTSYLNTSDGIISTGVRDALGAAGVFVAVAIAGVLWVVMKRRRARRI